MTPEEMKLQALRMQAKILQSRLGRGADPGRQIVPSQPGGELMTQGPGPGGHIDPSLYAMGAIGRRAAPAAPDAPATAMVERTGTEMPRVVTAADGTEFYLDPRTGRYADRQGMAMEEERRTSPAKALGLGYVRGYTVNAADEALGGVDAAKRERLRAMQDANQEAHPWLALTGEIAGAVTNPVARLIPAARTVLGGAGISGGAAAVDAFNRGEGDAASRGQDALEGGVGGFLFGLPFAMAGKGISKAYDGFARAAEKRPTVQNLKGLKTAAYRAVDESGEVFTRDDMAGLADRAKKILTEADFDDIADPQTAAALRLLEKRAGDQVTLSRLDRIRQTLWDRYNRGDEPLILDLIGEIDGLIDTRAGASATMRAARDANAVYRKAQMLDDAFKKAELQTESTGSGGNILNKYRQAVTSIVTNEKKAKWFSPQEIALMEAFIQGDVTENLLRRFGKMSPGGNGLMTFLNFYGATLDPSFLAVTGAAQAAKTSADNMSIAGKDRLLDAVSGFAPPAPQGPGLTPLGVGAGVAADNAWEERP